MNPMLKRILVILVMVAVLIYTVVNYLTERISLLYFAVFAAILLYPLVGLINGLIQDLKNR